MSSYFILLEKVSSERPFAAFAARGLRRRAQVSAKDLFDGRLEKFGIHEKKLNDDNETCRALTDGDNTLWVYIDDKNFVVGFSGYLNEILDAAVFATFDVDIEIYDPNDALHEDLWDTTI